MKGDVDPCIRLSILSASPLPRTGASSWVVEAKILRLDGQKPDEDEDEDEPLRTKPSRVGIWNEEVNVPLDAGDAQSCGLQLTVVDATLQEEGLKACTFQLGDFVPWNGYHLDGTGNDVSLRASKKKEPPLQRYDAADKEMVELDTLGTDRNYSNSYLRNMVPAAVVEDQVSWNESIDFPLGPRVKKVYMAHTRAYPRQLYGKGKRWSICQVSFLLTFFLVEASSQNSTALGFAVLEVPHDVRLSDVGVELSAEVTSPEGKVLEDVVCVVDIKAFGPVPRSPRESYVSSVGDEDVQSDLGASGTERSTSRSCSPSETSSTSTSEETSKSRTTSRTDTRKSRKKHEAKITSTERKVSTQIHAERELQSQVEAVRDQLQAAHADADRKQVVIGNLSEVRAIVAQHSLQIWVDGSFFRPSAERSPQCFERCQRAKCSPYGTCMGAHVHQKAQRIALASFLLRLSKQVGKRSDAIRKCGAEIVKLRKRIECIEEERSRLHSQLKALHRTTANAEMEANRVMNAIKGGHTSGGLNEDTGGLHTRAIAKRCIALTDENKTLRRIVQDCTHERWQAAVLKSEMENMRKTQHVQAVYIRKMQALPGKVSAYKSTVSMQEKVIAKLEMLMAGRRSVGGENTNDEEDAPATGVNVVARGPEVERLRKENASLRWRLAMAGTKSRNNPQGKTSDEAGVMLKIKDSKIRILEEQMVTNAKAAGDEIAALEMRLMEVEFEKSDT